MELSRFCVSGLPHTRDRPVSNMESLSVFVRRVNRVLGWLAIAGLCAMVLLTCANILLRLRWINRPLSGTTEIMGLLGACVTALMLSATQRRKENIAVDVLINHFSGIVRRWLRVFNAAICFAFFAIAGWQLTQGAMKLRDAGQVTETLGIADYPFVLVVAFGVFALAMGLLAELIEAVAGGRES